MVQISEVKGDGRQNRTAAHSHIRGLGLRSDGYAEKSSAGFVGQAAAREVSYDASLPFGAFSFKPGTAIVPCREVPC